jgi:hypothetical protein
MESALCIVTFSLQYLYSFIPIAVQDVLYSIVLLHATAKHTPTYPALLISYPVIKKVKRLPYPASALPQTFQSTSHRRYIIMASSKQQPAAVDTSAPPLLSPLSLRGPAKFAGYGAHVQHSAALHAFIALELPDIMLQYGDKPVRAIEMGREHDMNIDHLFRLLRIMADNHVVDIHRDMDVTGLQHYPYSYKPEYNTGFTLTEDGKLLTKDHPTVIIALYMHICLCYAQHFLHCVLTLTSFCGFDFMIILCCVDMDVMIWTYVYICNIRYKAYSLSDQI